MLHFNNFVPQDCKLLAVFVDVLFLNLKIDSNGRKYVRFL